MGQEPFHLFSFAVSNAVHFVYGSQWDVELHVHEGRCTEDHVDPTVEGKLIQAVMHQERLLSKAQNLLDLSLIENGDRIGRSLYAVLRQVSLQDSVALLA